MQVRTYKNYDPKQDKIKDKMSRIFKSKMCTSSEAQVFETWQLYFDIVPIGSGTY